MCFFKKQNKYYGLHLSCLLQVFPTVTVVCTSVYRVSATVHSFFKIMVDSVDSKILVSLGTYTNNEVKRKFVNF